MHEVSLRVNNRNLGLQIVPEICTSIRFNVEHQYFEFQILIEKLNYRENIINNNY